MPLNRLMYTILITRKLAPEIINKLSETCMVDVWEKDSAIPHDELIKRAAGKDGILCLLTDKIDREVLEAAGPNLKTISTMSVGHDHIDVDECAKRGITVGYTPDVLNDSVADLTIALMLNAGRRIDEAVNVAKDGRWGVWKPYGLTGIDLHHATVGIVGMGRIGIAVAKRLKGFDCKILYTSRTKKQELETEHNIEHVEFNELLERCDFVTVHAPLMPETKEMFNAEAFSKMKPSAVFINTSRGGLVDQDALYNALVSKQIYAAGLDVTSPEPLPIDNPLFALPNCTILPHIGSASISTRSKMGELAADNLLAGLTGTPLPYQVS